MDFSNQCRKFYPFSLEVLADCIKNCPWGVMLNFSSNFHFKDDDLKIFLPVMEKLEGFDLDDCMISPTGISDVIAKLKSLQNEGKAIPRLLAFGVSSQWEKTGYEPPTKEILMGFKEIVEKDEYCLTHIKLPWAKDDPEFYKEVHSWDFPETIDEIFVDMKWKYCKWAENKRYLNLKAAYHEEAAKLNAPQLAQICDSLHSFFDLLPKSKTKVYAEHLEKNAKLTNLPEKFCNLLFLIHDVYKMDVLEELKLLDKDGNIPAYLKNSGKHAKWMHDSEFYAKYRHSPLNSLKETLIKGS